ncbi:MAG: hypothetical protein V4456_11400 [Bacteroidota bacterium]
MRNLKFIILPILILLHAFGAKAQSGYKYVNIAGGYLTTPLNGITATLSLDFAGKYHDGFELFAEGYRGKYTQHLSFIPDTVTKKVVNTTNTTYHHTILVGGIYKPLLTRSKNTALRMKFGGGVGSNGKDFIIAPQAGFELSQAIGNNGFEVMLQQNNSYVFLDAQHWRSGLAIGFKIPLQ